MAAKCSKRERGSAVFCCRAWWLLVGTFLFLGILVLDQGVILGGGTGPVFSLEVSPLGMPIPANLYMWRAGRAQYVFWRLIGLVVGVFLAKRGWCSPPIDCGPPGSVAPRLKCCQCSYLLVNTSAVSRCPECGTLVALSLESPISPRKINRRAMAMAVVVVGTGLLLLPGLVVPHATWMLTGLSEFSGASVFWEQALGRPTGGPLADGLSILVVPLIAAPPIGVCIVVVACAWSARRMRHSALPRSKALMFCVLAGATAWLYVCAMTTWLMRWVG
jgi:hypothetical protein